MALWRDTAEFGVIAHRDSIRSRESLNSLVTKSSVQAEWRKCVHCAMLFVKD